MCTSINDIVEINYKECWSIRLGDQMSHLCTSDVCLKSSIEIYYKYFLLLGEAVERVLAFTEHKRVLLAKYNFSEERISNEIESAKEYFASISVWSFEFLMGADDDWAKQPIDEQMATIEREFTVDGNLRQNIRQGLYNCLRIGAEAGERWALADAENSMAELTSPV